MASRKTIYISDAAETVIGQADESLSGRINGIVIRYGGIVERDCPALTEAEWSAICDVLNGTCMLTDHTEMDPVRYIWVEISDGDRLNRLGDKWGIDAQDLATRVRDMTFAQQVAIAEITTCYWQHPKPNELGIGELLSECGARIQETAPPGQFHPLHRESTDYAWGECISPRTPDKINSATVCGNTLKFAEDGSSTVCPACGARYTCTGDTFVVA